MGDEQHAKTSLKCTSNRVSLVVLGLIAVSFCVVGAVGLSMPFGPVAHLFQRVGCLALTSGGAICFVITMVTLIITRCMEQSRKQGSPSARPMPPRVSLDHLKPPELRSAAPQPSGSQKSIWDGKSFSLFESEEGACSYQQLHRGSMVLVGPKETAYCRLQGDTHPYAVCLPITLDSTSTPSGDGVILIETGQEAGAATATTLSISYKTPACETFLLWTHDAEIHGAIDSLFRARGESSWSPKTVKRDPTPGRSV